MEIIYEKTIDLDEFIEENRNNIREYICPLCQGIIFDVVIDVHSHLFCRKCFNKYHSVNGQCPVLKTPMDKKDVNNFLFYDRIFEKQDIYCKNKKSGCIWVGKYHDRKKHIEKECLKEPIVCTNTECLVKLPREEIFKEHSQSCQYRLIKCGKCFSEIIFNKSEQHEHECPDTEIPCPNSCDVLLKRKLMKEHVEEICELTILNCPFNLIGCKVKLNKKEIKDHLENNAVTHNNELMRFMADFKSNYVNKLSSIEQIYSSLDQRICKVEDTFLPKINKENKLNGRKRKRLISDDEESPDTRLNHVLENAHEPMNSKSDKTKNTDSTCPEL